MLVYLAANMDNFLIAIVLGPIALGYYVIAYRIFVVATEVLVTTINRVALTTFSRFQRDPQALNSAFTSATSITAYITLPCFAALAVLAHPLITIVFGAKWAPSVPVLQALTVAGVVQGQTNFTGNYAIAVGRMNNQLAWLTCLVAVQMIAFVVSVNFGIVAVAASLSIVTLLAWPVRLLQLRKWHNLDLYTYFSRSPGVLLATGAMAAVVLAMRTNSGPSSILVAVEIAEPQSCTVAAATAPQVTSEVRTTLQHLRRQFLPLSRGSHAI